MLNCLACRISSIANKRSYKHFTLRLCIDSGAVAYPAGPTGSGTPSLLLSLAFHLWFTTSRLPSKIIDCNYPNLISSLFGPTVSTQNLATFLAALPWSHCSAACFGASNSRVVAMIYLYSSCPLFVLGPIQIQILLCMRVSSHLVGCGLIVRIPICSC